MGDSSPSLPSMDDSPPPPPPPRSRPRLGRIAASYARMCRLRQVSEISSRNAITKVAEFQLPESGFELLRATHENQNQATKIFLTTLLDFAAQCFDEFETLSKEEKWTIIHNCYGAILFLDGIYRSQRDFSDHPQIIYGHMTYIGDPDDVDDFFGEPHNPYVIKILKQSMMESPIHDRKVVQGIEEEEFYAILGLVLWNTEEDNLTDKVVKIFEKHRRAVLKELHSYYTSVKENEYASRIGRLFDAIRSVKSGLAGFRIGVETVRVLDVVGDDTFIWHLLRA